MIAPEVFFKDGDATQIKVTLNGDVGYLFGMQKRSRLRLTRPIAYGWYLPRAF